MVFLFTGKSGLIPGSPLQLLYLILHPLYQHRHHAAAQFGLIAEVVLPLYFGKMAYNNTSEHAPEPKVFLNHLFDVSQLLVVFQGLKHTLTLFEILPENMEQQFILQFEYGAQGFILKMLCEAAIF